MSTEFIAMFGSDDVKKPVRSVALPFDDPLYDHQQVQRTQSVERAIGVMMRDEFVKGMLGDELDPMPASPMPVDEVSSITFTKDEMTEITKGVIGEFAKQLQPKPSAVDERLAKHIKGLAPLVARFQESYRKALGRELNEKEQQRFGTILKYGAKYVADAVQGV